MLDQNEGLPRTWGSASANVVDCLDDPDFPRYLVSALKTLVSFDHCEQVVYSSDAIPVLIYDLQLDDCYRRGLQNYLRHSYILNPFYRMCRAGLPSGVYRLKDLAVAQPGTVEDLMSFRASPKANEEIGYLTDGLPEEDEELCISLATGGDEFAGITLSRAKSAKGFTGSEIGLLSSVLPFVKASFRRYWRNARFTHIAGAKIGLVPMGQTLGCLSPREREVVQLLLNGHSTLSISLRLDISQTTVKTHRKNLYAKLGIATQFELFKLFSDSLAGNPQR